MTNIFYQIYRNIFYGAIPCGHFARARPSLSGSFLKCLLRAPKGYKISENLELFRKARNSKISEIFDTGGATKNLGYFWSRGSSLRNEIKISLASKNIICHIRFF